MIFFPLNISYLVHIFNALWACINFDKTLADSNNQYYLFCPVFLLFFGDSMKEKQADLSLVLFSLSSTCGSRSVVMLLDFIRASMHFSSNCTKEWMNKRMNCGGSAPPHLFQPSPYIRGVQRVSQCRQSGNRAAGSVST